MMYVVAIQPDEVKNNWPARHFFSQFMVNDVIANSVESDFLKAKFYSSKHAAMEGVDKILGLMHANTVDGKPAKSGYFLRCALGLYHHAPGPDEHFIPDRATGTITIQPVRANRSVSLGPAAMTWNISARLFEDCGRNYTDLGCLFHVEQQIISREPEHVR